MTSYFHKMHASSIANDITLAHNLNLFRDSLRSWQAFITRTMGGWGGEIEVATVDPASGRYFRGGEDGPSSAAENAA